MSYCPKPRPDRRSVRRWNVLWPATLKIAGRDYPCTIMDLSELGARVEAPGIQFEPMRAELNAEQFGALAGHFRWAQGGRAGLQFEAAAEAVMQVLKPVVPGLGRRDGTVVTPSPAAEKPRSGRLARLRNAFAS
jgi:hypothetical protein